MWENIIGIFNRFLSFWLIAKIICSKMYYENTVSSRKHKYCNKTAVTPWHKLQFSEFVSMVIPPLARVIYPVIPKPFCNQFWKHWFICKQESMHIMLLHLFRAPRGTEWTHIWLTARQGSEHGGGWRGWGGCTLHHGDSQHTDGPHTWQCNESAAPPQVSLRAKHISSWFSRLTGKTPLPSTPRTNLDAACNKQRKILRNAGCPNWKKRKGMGLAACMILWLCRSEYSGKLSPLLIHGKLITALIL